MLIVIRERVDRPRSGSSGQDLDQESWCCDVFLSHAFWKSCIIVNGRADLILLFPSVGFGSFTAWTNNVKWNFSSLSSRWISGRGLIRSTCWRGLGSGIVCSPILFIDLFGVLGARTASSPSSWTGYRARIRRRRPNFKGRSQFYLELLAHPPSWYLLASLGFLHFFHFFWISVVAFWIYTFWSRVAWRDCPISIIQRLLLFSSTASRSHIFRSTDTEWVHRYGFIFIEHIRDHRWKCFRSKEYAGYGIFGTRPAIDVCFVRTNLFRSKYMLWIKLITYKKIN